jgi:hypothetical protein
MWWWRQRKYQQNQTSFLRSISVHDRGGSIITYRKVCGLSMRYSNGIYALNI